MRLNTPIAFAIGCVSLLALIVPAFGVPAPTGADKKNARPHGLAQKSAHLAQKGKAISAARDNNRLVTMPVSDSLRRARVSSSPLISEARKYMGTNPTARKKLWCATFMNMILRKTGYAGTNSDAARSFAQYGHRISSPQVGAIAVLTRGKTGGHVGVVTGIDPNGNPIILSGNHGHRVGEGVYPRSRVIAYVMPTESRSLTQVADRSGSVHLPEQSLDSPIAELIAAIEAEQAKSDTTQQQQQQQQQQPQPVRPTQQQQQSQPVRAAQQQPAPTMYRAGESADAPRVVEASRAPEPPRPAEPVTPHRTVQQTPDQDMGRLGSVDPSVADLFGLKDRAAAPLPPRSVPMQQRPQHQQRPGRIAAADLSAR